MFFFERANKQTNKQKQCTVVLQRSKSPMCSWCLLPLDSSVVHWSCRSFTLNIKPTRSELT